MHIKSRTAACLAALLAVAIACGCRAAADGRTLVGQVLLPHGEGRRGLELWVTETATGREPRATWVLFDAEGRFAHRLQGSLTGVTVTAGSAEVYRLDAANVSGVDPEGRVDVGGIDLRERLIGHHLALRPATGSPGGDVRVALWFGPPPVGPFGEPVSLGSAQFPEVALGGGMEWLLPREARSIHFLVERPADSGRGREWRSGQQQLFGPFILAELPAELIVD